MELHVFIVLLAHSLQGLLAGPPVEVTPDRIILLENRPLEVKCRVRQPIAYCRFDVPGIADGLNLRPGHPPHQGIQYLGAGLEQGECGMLIQGVSSKHNGVIKCSMGFNNEPTESKGNLTLIVAKPPDPPILTTYPGSTYRDSFREGEIIQANCKIINARPVANISWYLGSEPIYDRLGPTVIEEENGLMSISQNMTRKVTYLDHGKDLKCVAGHIALRHEDINHSINKLNIRFPPKPKSQELEKFGFTIGQPEKIVVTFMANPIPDIIWKVDQDNLKPGTRDRTGRFEAGILQHKGAGLWDAVLLIHTVRAEEVEKRYTLIAQNELGRESYKVAISTSPEPPADITAGTIVGIVIAVLVILLLVFILIFARATGRWCFAGGVPRPAGESFPSYRWFLGNKSQRNPQKVHSLVYKDYTLVEYEDGTKSYVSPEEKAQLTLKGKLASSKVSLEDEKPKTTEKDSESESDSGYEIPMAREKPKSCDDLDKTQKKDMKRNSSFPFSGGEISPGDNGRINLPPYIVPLETSLTFPMTKQKQKDKKKSKIKRLHAEDVEKSLENTSLDEADTKKRFTYKDTFWPKKKSSTDTDESPEDAEVREITENNEVKRFSMSSNSETEEKAKPSNFFKAMKLNQETKKDKSDTVKGLNKDAEEKVIVDHTQLEEPVEIFPQELGAKEDDGFKRFSHGFYLPKFPEEPLKSRKRNSRNKKLDPNPLKKMFGIRGVKKAENDEGALYPAGQGLVLETEEEPQAGDIQGRYSDAVLSQIQSDTESADHGSADKSSVSKLTSEKQPKKLVSGLFGSFRKGRNKERMSDIDPGNNSLSFEIAVKDQPEDIGQTDVTRAEGIVYAELDMGRSPSSVMRRDDEKTEYAEIIYPVVKPVVERAGEVDLRQSRENLTSSRENLTEVDEAYLSVAEGKKEAAV